MRDLVPNERNRDVRLANLQNRCVREVMTASLVTVFPATAVADAVWICQDAGIHHLLVVERGELRGITCLFDLREADHEDTVERCMTTPVVCIGPATRLQEALELMRARGIGCLPVVESRRLVGIVTRGDLRKAGFPAEEVADPVCAACGSHHHVKLHPRM